MLSGLIKIFRELYLFLGNRYLKTTGLVFTGMLNQIHPVSRNDLPGGSIFRVFFKNSFQEPNGGVK